MALATPSCAAMSAFVPHDSTLVAASGAVPKILVEIICMLISLYGLESRCMSVELFAGCHSVTNGVKALGFPAIGLDVSTVSDMDDITSNVGFLRALTYVLSLCPGGLLWAAPPCSSWVWATSGAERAQLTAYMQNPNRFSKSFAVGGSCCSTGF